MLDGVVEDIILASGGDTEKIDEIITDEVDENESE